MSVDNEIQKSAEEAAKVEQEAIAQKSPGVYTHVFKKPFTHDGTTYSKLTFDFESLTGKDSLAVERELLSNGITLVTKEFNDDYLVGMAARACTYRDDNGNRTVSKYTIAGMPVGDFNRICKEVRGFLIRSGR